jgi:hypothetical protein
MTEIYTYRIRRILGYKQSTFEVSQDDVISKN